MDTPEHIDPHAAKWAMDQRFSESGDRSTSAIADSDWVAAQLQLRDAGITHDEEIVRLYQFALWAQRS